MKKKEKFMILTGNKNKVVEGKKHTVVFLINNIGDLGPIKIVNNKNIILMLMKRLKKCMKEKILIDSNIRLKKNMISLINKILNMGKKIIITFKIKYVI